MNPLLSPAVDDEALVWLLSKLAAGKGYALITYDELMHWGLTLVECFVQLGVLTQAESADYLQCKGCEEQCFSKVHFRAATDTPACAFIACDHPIYQAEMGRILLEPERLQQWSINLGLLAKVIARPLGLQLSAKDLRQNEFVQIGFLMSPKGRKKLILHADPLSLALNGHVVPVDELLYFDDKDLCIDHARIKELLKVKAKPKPKKYERENTKQQLRKLATEEKY